MGCSLWHWHSGKEAVCGKGGIQTGREALTIRPWLLSVLSCPAVTLSGVRFFKKNSFSFWDV